MFLGVIPVVIALTGQAAPPPQTPPPPPPARVVPAQTVGAPAQTPRPVPKLYNETANAREAIAAAVKAADTDDIRVLINWGANDNARCTAFTVAQRAKEVNATYSFFSDEYKVAYVDVGRGDKNLDVAKAYGVTIDAEVLPALTVLDDKGKVLANISSRELNADNDEGFDAKKIAAFLTQHKAPAPDAIAPFEAAVKQAKQEGKTLFVWFSAPW
jgi:hypothetical protein